MSESFLNDRVILRPGDCLQVLAELPENSIDAVVCDPPYHLTSIVKRFGAENAAPTKIDAFARGTSGFMGKAWDGGDIAFRPETWAAVLRVLKPGGYILAFSSSRTFGRMSVALEDAGFITHPMIGWVFGSGFPKATRIRAEGYDGFRYGAQSLKPALEPIYMGQKPFSEANGTENVLRWGTGAVNVDGCRVAAADGDYDHPGDLTPRPMAANAYAAAERGDLKVTQAPPNALGRWPANLVLSDDPEVIAAFPEAPGQQFATGPKYGAKRPLNTYGSFGERDEFGPRGDSGSAARFFFQAKRGVQCGLCGWLCEPSDSIVPKCDAVTAEPSSPTESIQSECTARSGAVDLLLPDQGGTRSPARSRASSAESCSAQCLQPEVGSAQPSALQELASSLAQNVRSAAVLCGSCETAIALSLAASRLGLDLASPLCQVSITEPKRQILTRSLALYVAGRENTDIIGTTASLKMWFGSVLPVIAGSISSDESEGRASIDPALRRFHYSSKADADDRLGSKHPTVKPLDLMRWLVRLVTPPGGLVLDPFAGTGTTGEAAFREGMRAVLIEREAEYQTDIRRRMALLMAGPDERKRAIVKAKPEAAFPAGSLFAPMEAAE